MKKIISIFLISIVAFTGCDFLTEEDKGGISNDQLYSTEAGFETLMTASYATLRSIYGPAPWLSLGGTDMYQIGRNNSHTGMYYYALFPTDGDVTTFYRSCYESIQTLNMGLLYISYPDIDESTRKRYEAELRFLRAYYHFILIEQFGGIVISDQATRTAVTSLSRSSLDESYNFVISEMETVLNDLGNTKGRVTQDVANHFLAKVYLTRGWDKQSPSDFNKSKEYALKIINKMGDINVTYERLWDPWEHDNNEIIFAVQYDLKSLSSRNNGTQQQAMYINHLGGNETLQKSTSTEMIIAWNLHMWYTENDNRYKVTFMDILYERYWDYYYVEDKSALNVRAWYPRVWGRKALAEYREDSLAFVTSHNLVDRVGGIPTLRNYYPFVEDELLYRRAIQQDFNMACVKKFDDPYTFDVREGRASSRDVVLARLSETYYLYAEACIATNDYSTALTYVQKVLDRPGNLVNPSGEPLPNAFADAVAKGGSQQQILEGFLIESAKEFIGEYNGRWPELRRTRMLKYMLERYSFDYKSLNTSLDFDNKYNLRPIPQRAFDLNDALDPVADQNPGY